MYITYAVFPAETGCNNTVSFKDITSSATKHEAYLPVANDKEGKINRLYAMKTYKVSGGVTPFILTLNWGWK
jgi:hypothetical protein